MAIVINGSGTVTGISVGGLPDGIVDSGTLADDAVGLAQMAGGTDGNIITYDASGNPAAVATGSAGQVLTSAGAGAAPTMATGTGFHAHNSVAQSISSATTTKILFQTEIYDHTSNYASSRFTIPSDGKYYLYTNLMLSAMADQGFANLVIRKNASTDMVYHTLRGSSTSYVSTSAFVTVDADADDYFEVFLYNSAACDVNYTSTGSYTTFGGFKLI
jgi:hypothetical protein